MMLLGAGLMLAGAIFFAYMALRAPARPEVPCDESPNLTVAHLIDGQFERTLRDIHDLPERVS